MKKLSQVANNYIRKQSQNRSDLNPEYSDASPIEKYIGRNEYEEGDFAKLRELNTKILQLKRYRDKVNSEINEKLESINSEWNQIVRRNGLDSDARSSEIFGKIFNFRG